MINPLITFLQLLRFLSNEDQQLICSAFETRAFKEGDVLFKSGRVCHELFFICEGILRIVKMNEKGVEVTYFFVKENQFCTILHSFNNDVPAQESIQAACNAEVLVISKSKLLALYKQLPYFRTMIDQITQQRLLDKVRIRNSYLGEDSASRYRLFIMQHPDIALRVPLKDIASYLGITPQSLSRIRKNL